MQLPRCVLLMGNRNAGKDTICDYLVARLGYTKRGFSDPIYGTLAKLNPLIDTGVKTRRYNDLVAEFGLDYTKRNFREVRKHLQILGTEGARDLFGNDCWVKLMEQRSRYDRLTCIRDTRFKNEVKWGRSTPDPLFLHVWSDREEPQSDHRSEIQLDYAAEADYTLSNNGTLEELYDAVEDVLQQWATQHN